MGVESLVSSVAGPVISSALGGDTSGATSAQVGGAAQASAAFAAAVQQAIQQINQSTQTGQNFLQQYFNTGNTYTQPYQDAGFEASDALNQQLGLGTPKIGSLQLSRDEAAYQKALDDYNKQQDQVTQAQKDAKAFYDKLDTINKNQDYANANYNASPQDLANRIQGTLNNMYHLQPGGGGWNSNGMIPMGQDFINKYQGITGPTGPKPQESDFVPAGGKDLVTMSPQNALSQYFNTPEYQLLFGSTGAAVDPNASPLDRFQGSPGYQFQLQQGTKALDASAASKGMLLSGNQLQDLQKYGTGLANQDWNNYFNQMQNTYGNYISRLGGVAGTGANIGSQGRALANTTGGNLANLSQAQGQDIANLYAQQGAVTANSILAAAGAQASGALSAAQQQNQLAGGIGNAFTNFFKNQGSSFFNGSSANDMLPTPNLLTGSSFDF